MKKILLFVILAGLWGCKAQEQGRQLPKPDHVVIVMEENHSYDRIINSPDAPFINELAKKGANFTDAHGITHPSQPNYVAIFSGALHGVTDDHCLKDTTPYHSINMGWALIDAGYSFAGYSETMPDTGYTGCGYGKSKYKDGSPLYARKHNPWVDWQGDGSHNLPETTNLPFSAFPSDYSKLPTVSFVVPNEDHEMHNGKGSGPIREADAWLKQHLQAYADWAMQHNSLLIITYDEDDGTPQNHIPTIFVGSMVKPGDYDTNINLVSILRTVEAMYGLQKSGTIRADTISGVWR